MTPQDASYETGQDNGFVFGLGAAVLLSATLSLAYFFGAVSFNGMLGWAVVGAVAISVLIGRWFP